MTAFSKKLRIVLLIIALALMVSGLMLGGFMDVLSKAVMICMECIGIG